MEEIPIFPDYLVKQHYEEGKPVLLYWTQVRFKRESDWYEMELKMVFPDAGWSTREKSLEKFDAIAMDMVRRQEPDEQYKINVK